METIKCRTNKIDSINSKELIRVSPTDGESIKILSSECLKTFSTWKVYKIWTA